LGPILERKAKERTGGHSFDRRKGWAVPRRKEKAGVPHGDSSEEPSTYAARSSILLERGGRGKAGRRRNLPLSRLYDWIGKGSTMSDKQRPPNLLCAYASKGKEEEERRRGRVAKRPPNSCDKGGRSTVMVKNGAVRTPWRNLRRKRRREIIVLQPPFQAKRETWVYKVLDQPSMWLKSRTHEFERPKGGKGGEKEGKHLLKSPSRQKKKKKGPRRVVSTPLDYRLKRKKRRVRISYLGKEGKNRKVYEFLSLDLFKDRREEEGRK